MVLEISAMEADIIIKLLIATGLGLLIGLERELNKSAAGLKTFSIVCLGSALFTVATVSLNITSAVSGVISGIGFLGAAVVFRGPDKVSGLTTAALVWTTAAIGVAVGFGLYFAAATVALLVLVILIPVEYVEKKLLKKHRQ